MKLKTVCATLTAALLISASAGLLLADNGGKVPDDLRK